MLLGRKTTTTRLVCLRKDGILGHGIGSLVTIWGQHYKGTMSAHKSVPILIWQMLQGCKTPETNQIPPKECIVKPPLTNSDLKTSFIIILYFTFITPDVIPAIPFRYDVTKWAT